MEETKNICIFDDKQLFSISDASPIRDLLRLPESDYQKKEKEMLTINKGITDDHLTATYWG
jgi:hypothetical protein